MKLYDRLTTGDVIYTSCVGLPFCYHLGIVVESRGKKRIFHNSPYNTNRFGGSVCVETYEQFMKERQVVKVYRTGVSKRRIVSVSKRCSREIWDTFFFNCEDYILEVVEGHRRSDLRDAWKIGALAIIAYLILE